LGLDTRLHVIIQDQNQTVYQVPESVLPRPNGTGSANSDLQFTYTTDPFSFAVSRTGGEVLFNTSGSPMIFESQYLRLRTSLPSEPNLYGLGEHSDSFRLNTTNYTRTLWSRDAYGIPAGTNLYGNHPIYIDHRGENGTHGVLFLNSNGMDIKINDTDGQYLEYNTIGGVFDFYFLAGPSPVEVAEQISGVVGLPAMVSYGAFGYHQCRYGYRDVYQVAEVVYNYSQARIPLETQWIDINYMRDREVFTLDPERYPLPKMRELVDYLHEHDQYLTVMVDPAVAYQDYPAFNNGRDQDIFLKFENGSIYQGVVWPGVSPFLDPSASISIHIV
jgi:alpha-glucosidase